MTNKFSIADSVASDMNSLMTSDEYRTLFSRPQVKTAESKCKLHDKNCDCKNCPQKCDCADCMDKVGSEKKEASLDSALNDLIAISAKLDEAGFEKSASLALAAAEFLVSEAKKKSKKEDKKEDKKDDKKGKKPFPFAKKKDKKEDDGDEDDKKEDKKGKKGKKPFPFAKKPADGKKKTAQREFGEDILFDEEPSELGDLRCEKCGDVVGFGEAVCEDCAEHEMELGTEGLEDEDLALPPEREEEVRKECIFCDGEGCEECSDLVEGRHPSLEGLSGPELMKAHKRLENAEFGVDEEEEEEEKKD